MLRHPHGHGNVSARLEVRLSPLLAASAPAVVFILTMAYWAFAHGIRGDVTTIPLVWVACAAAGYLLYAVNGILFDVLVLRRSLLVVALHVTAFLAIGTIVQVVAISAVGVPGWALGWLVFNAVVAYALAREGLQLRFVGWTRHTSID